MAMVGNFGLIESLGVRSAAASRSETRRVPGTMCIDNSSSEFVRGKSLSCHATTTILRTQGQALVRV